MADSSRALPEGWRIYGLWYGIGSGNPEFRRTESQRDITNAEIESADRIIVTYTSRRTGATDYRTITGAMSKVQVGNIIRYTVRPESPVGRSSR